MNSSTAIGKDRRFRRIFAHASGKILIVPLDDSLLSGPILGLELLGDKVSLIAEGLPDAIVGFKGLFLNHATALNPIPGILNLTASTIRSLHTKKCITASVEEAAQLGMDAVAVHVNLTSRYESEMLNALGLISRQCETFGMPLLAHMYVRTEKAARDDNYEELKRNDPNAYTKLVAHAARVGMEMGADLIKTHYTGDSDTFRDVVDACAPIPVVVAGGPPVESLQILKFAHGALEGGAAGISFGRNIFSQRDPRPIMAALKMIIHERATPEQALLKMRLPDDVNN